MDGISRYSRAEEGVRFGNLRIASPLFCRWCGCVSFTGLWPLAWPGAVCEAAWMSQLLQVRGHGSLTENSGLGMSFYPKCSNRVWDGQAIWCVVSSNAGVAPDRCGVERAKLEGRASELPVDTSQPSSMNSACMRYLHPIFTLLLISAIKNHSGFSLSFLGEKVFLLLWETSWWEQRTERIKPCCKYSKCGT